MIFIPLASETSIGAMRWRKSDDRKEEIILMCDVES